MGVVVGVVVLRGVVVIAGVLVVMVSVRGGASARVRAREDSVARTWSGACSKSASSRIMERMWGTSVRGLEGFGVECREGR